MDTLMIELRVHEMVALMVLQMAVSTVSQMAHWMEGRMNSQMVDWKVTLMVELRVE